jgi:hypothetical protein
VLAQETLPGDACQQAQRSLQEIELTSRQLDAQLAELAAFNAGEMREAIGAAQLEQLFGAASEPTPPRADIRCATLRDEYEAAIERLASQRAELASLREAYLDAIPPPARLGLERMRTSGERVAASAKTLRGLLDQKHLSTVHDSAAEYLALLDTLRGEYLALLPSLGGEVDASDVRAWLSRWRHALDIALSNKQRPVDDTVLSRTQREALDTHWRLLQFDASTIATSYSLVRGWLWESHHRSFRAAAPTLDDRLALLRDESRAIANAFFWLYLDTVSQDDTLTGRMVWWRLLFGFEYLLGLSAFAVLALLARRAEQLASHWQASFARRYRGNRSVAQLVRLTAGIPEWLPWLISWLGLRVLEIQFRQYGLELLLPLLPFAELFVVFGLLSMAGEWFVLRMVELAGSFLNEAQHAMAVRRSRRAAGIVVLPWLLMNFVRLSLGPSLALSRLDVLTVLALLLALGLLLRPWQDEFIRALQSFLPARLDGPCNKLFRGHRFVLLAPLAAPLVLLAMAAFFAHKGLVTFDWYRTLMARSFLLSSTLPEEAAQPESNPQALAEYRRWFDTAAESEELPVIRSAMTDILENILSDWLEERSEENTLLLHGERNCGKTLLLKRLERSLAEREAAPQVNYIAIPAKSASPKALAELLEPVFNIPLQQGPAELVKSDTERPPVVVILDNAQNLFLRSVGGLTGWEFLLSLTRARLRNVYWIISINNQSWSYLANVFGRYYQFNKLVQTQPWSQAEIRSLILSRNQLSGFKIEYDRILLSSRGPEAGNIRNAEQLYFSLLWDACKGNPGIALQLWLSSITVSASRVRVGLPEEVPGAALERLSDDLYFVYAALILHENMTSDEVEETTALPESLVRSALKIAFDTGFVERSENRRYRIVPIWYRTVIRLMARKNLLHE